jgi:hypothetical protein
MRSPVRCLLCKTIKGHFLDLCLIASATALTYPVKQGQVKNKHAIFSQLEERRKFRNIEQRCSTIYMPYSKKDVCG